MIGRFLPKSEFARNVLMLMTGTTIAQAIPVVISPILTRIYSPEDFGVFALYMAVASIISVIATGRYEMAIMLPKKDSDAANLVVLSILIALCVSLVTFIVVLFFSKNIAHFLGSPEISNWLFFVPFTVLLTACYQSFNYWANRKKYYNKLAANRIVQSGSVAISNLTLGGLEFKFGGMIFSQVLGQIISTILLVETVFKKDYSSLKSVNKLKLIRMAKKYIIFPKITIWSSLINSIYNNGKFMIFSFVLSSNIMGQLYLTFRVLMIPVSIISTNIADVLFQRMSIMSNENKSKKEILRQLLKIICILMLIILIPSLIIYMYGEALFSLAFGDMWFFAGKYASILSVALFFQFSIAPLCKIFYVLEKNNLYLSWELFRVLVVFIPFLLLGYYGVDTDSLIIVMSISISISYLFLLFLLVKVLYVE